MFLPSRHFITAPIRPFTTLPTCMAQMDPTESTNQQQLVCLDAKDQNEVEKIKLQLIKAEDEATTSSATKKEKRKVLDEDEYTDRIASIIEKDFFPDVTKLRFELEYQNALEQNDFDKLQQLGQQKLNANQRPAIPSDTPAAFETPMNWQTEFDITKDDKKKNESNKNNKEKIETEKFTLTKFLNKFTSQDNASFEQLQDEADRKHQERLEFLNKDTKSHNDRVQNALTLPSMETQVLTKAGLSTNESGDRLISWPYSHKNTVMFDPDGAPLTAEEQDKLRVGKKIFHENTRFKTKPFVAISNRSADKTLHALKHGKIGVDGKEITSSATPSVNGFKFVPSTPSFAPETLPDSPFMTWGEIDATPMNIRGDATPLVRADLTPSSTHFTIPDLSHREKVGQELATRILTKKKKDTNRNEDGKDASFHSGFDRLNTMSPAAQLLARKKLGLGNMDKSLQASYSPIMSSSVRLQTPTPKHFITPSPISKLTPSTNKRTPSIASTDKKHTAYQPNISTTKRAKASEFF